jgi:hypothetical protein
MPTEMGPHGGSDQAPARPRVHWFSRVLNWAAVVIGFGLCFWALNYDVIP